MTSSSLLSIILYGQQDNLLEVDVNKESLTHVEDVVFWCCRKVEVNNVGRYLFSLFYPSNDGQPWTPRSSTRRSGARTSSKGYWLSPNQDIREWMRFVDEQSSGVGSRSNNNNSPLSRSNTMTSCSSQPSIHSGSPLFIRQSLEQLTTTTKAPPLLEFRLRFKPSSLSILRTADPAAFNYYYFQVRNDFRQIKYDKNNPKETTPRVLGIAIADALRYILDAHPDISDGETAVDLVEFDKFLPPSYENQKKWFKLFKTESVIREEMIRAWHNSRRSSFVAKEEFMSGVMGSLLPNLHTEDYLVETLGHSGTVDTMNNQVIVRFDSGTHVITSKGIHADDHIEGEILCSIEEISCVQVSWRNNNDTILISPEKSSPSSNYSSLYSKLTGHNKHPSHSPSSLDTLRSLKSSIQISRNGQPVTLFFSSDLLLKSFVSLIDGYYRLSQKWYFSNSISRDVYCPSLSTLAKLRCHGPVGFDFSKQKLKEKSDDGKVGYFVLRQPLEREDVVKMDVKISSNDIVTLAISITCDPNSGEKMFHYSSQSSKSLPDLINHLVINMSEDGSRELRLNASLCLHPSVNDKSDNLLLCRLPQSDKIQSTRTRDFHVIKSTSLTRISSSSVEIIPSNRTNFRKSSQSYFSVTIALDSSHGNRKVAVKRLIDQDNVGDILTFHRFINDWLHVKCDCIISLIGVTMDPLSLVMEYLPLGPLDVFLSKNQSLMKQVDLIKAGTYVARALWYLEDCKLSHGAIRCHNVLVSKFDSDVPDSLQVKLSDPLSVCDASRDIPWLPPELRSNVKSGIITTSRIESDVYAFGTTLWEIFSYGKTPTSQYDLTKPFDCPPEVWDIVKEGCWIELPQDRKCAQAIVRDMNQILYEVYDVQRHNHYTPLDESTSSRSSNKSNKNSGGNFIRSVLGSMSNLSMRSSVMSKDTVLTRMSNSSSTGVSKSTSDLISLSSTTDGGINHQDGMNPYDLTDELCDTETWVIELNQLSFEGGKVLGQGCYGEVVKATLTRWCGLKTEIVAVKKINPTVPLDLGIRDMRREIEIMKQLSHKNIVEIKGFVEEPQVMLVMEYIDMGSLVSYLRMMKSLPTSSRGGSPLPLLKFASDILDGMIYLEGKSIVHRDLAARNVLVASPTHVKISDFGLAQFIDSGYYRIQTQRGLPFRWYAPESLENGKFSHKSDVWSFGVTLWEMYTYGKDPEYEGVGDDCRLLEALQTGIRLKIPPSCPGQVYHIMMDCWNCSDEERPSFSKLKTDIESLADG